MGSDSGEDLIVGFTFEGSLDFAVLLVLCCSGFLVTEYQKFPVSQVWFCYKYFVVVVGPSAL